MINFHCTECSSITDCETCAAGYYLDTSTNPDTCIQCHHSCSSCDEDGCIECADPDTVPVVVNGETICKFPCDFIPECDECSSLYDCTDCESGFEVYLPDTGTDNKCKAICTEGEEYLSEDKLTCIPCHDSCDTCDVDGNCVECDEDYPADNGTPLINGQGIKPNGKTCIVSPCPPPGDLSCITCSWDADWDDDGELVCENCDYGLIYNEVLNRCEEPVCTEDEFMDTTVDPFECKDCDFRCNGCDGPGNDECEECANEDDQGFIAYL